MKRAVFGLILMAMMTLLGCGGSEEAAPVAAQSPVTEAVPQATESSARIDQLLNAWRDAGLKAEMKEALRSNTINATYGSSRHFQLILNDRMVVVLEFDLKNLSSTGTNFLKFVEENGFVRRTNEPAWRSGEYVLLDTATLIQNGDVIEQFSLKEHPDRDRILQAFETFQ